MPNRRPLSAPPPAPRPARSRRPVRTAAKAVIVEDGRLLVITKRDREGPFHLLPGGGQRPGESLVDCLRRECREELGAEIEPGPLLFLRDYVSAHHDFAHRDPDFHQLEAVFTATLRTRPDPTAASEQDFRQEAIEWIPLADLPARRFFPHTIARLLAATSPEALHPAYLGDVN